MTTSRIATKSLAPRPVRRWTQNPDACRNEDRRRKGLQVMLSDEERYALEALARLFSAPLSRVVAAAVDVLESQTIVEAGEAIREAMERKA